jgi:hypothetical protein
MCPAECLQKELLDFLVEQNVEIRRAENDL